MVEDMLLAIWPPPMKKRGGEELD